MIYKHKYFILDDKSRKVFDENNKELYLTGNAFRVLVFLCARGPATIMDIGDYLDSSKDYDENHIRQYRYKINTIIGKNVVEYKNNIYSIIGDIERVEKLERNGRNTDLLRADGVKFKEENNKNMKKSNYCKKCGKENKEKHKFCVFCGILLEKEKYKSVSIKGDENNYRFFKLVIGIGILLISGSIFYYFIIFLPAKENNQKADLIAKDAQIAWCLSTADSIYFSKCKTEERICKSTEMVCNKQSNDPTEQETVNSLCAKLTILCENKCKPSDDISNNLKDDCFKQYR